MVTEVTLVKLGGSLITDKHFPETPRLDIIERLADQIGRARRHGIPLVVGHGSGSFGHPAARRAGLAGLGAGEASPPGPPEPNEVARVQAKAAELHGIVLDALVRAGAAPFSVPPSAVAVADHGRIERFHADTVRAALEEGFTPVVYGDIVLDRAFRAAICSTESALAALADALRAAGWRVRRCLWLGATAGVLTADGRVLERVSARNADALLAAAGGAVATDVTGGMRHRVDAALTLARAGVASWIGDGAAPAALERLLAGEPVPGTLVVP